MDFGFTPEQEAFRQEVRQFIRENVTPEVIQEQEDIHNENRTQVPGRGPKLRALFEKLGQKGWIGLSWPKEYGGAGRSRMDQYIFEEEMDRAGILLGSGGSGAPTIMAVGTKEQKEYFLPRILRGEITFAEGFTEPSGGADLASLQTRAVRDGDYYVIDGQKMFTSAAHYATHLYLMARTNPDVPKHKGISIFLVPMNTPGITVRPLWTVQSDPRAPVGTTYGSPRTNETFLEGVRVPRTSLLGEENQGWYVGAMGLNLDRVGARRYRISIHQDEDLINWVKRQPAVGYSLRDDPAVRDKLVEMWIEAQVCRLMTMRSMSIWQQNREFTYEGSAEKVWAPEHGVRSTEAATQVLGPYAQLLNGSLGAVRHGIFAHNVLGAYESTINHGGAGIMRDQVARRGLGLPRGS